MISGPNHLVLECIRPELAGIATFMNRLFLIPKKRHSCYNIHNFDPKKTQKGRQLPQNRARTRSWASATAQSLLCCLLTTDFACSAVKPRASTAGL